MLKNLAFGRRSGKGLGQMLLVLVLRNRRRMRLVLRLKRLWWREGKVRALYKANLHTDDIGVGRGDQASTTKFKVALL